MSNRPQSLIRKLSLSKSVISARYVCSSCSILLHASLASFQVVSVLWKGVNQQCVVPVDASVYTGLGHSGKSSKVHDWLICATWTFQRFRFTNTTGFTHCLPIRTWMCRCLLTQIVKLGDFHVHVLHSWMSEVLIYSNYTNCIAYRRLGVCCLCSELSVTLVPKCERYYMYWTYQPSFDKGWMMQ